LGDRILVPKPRVIATPQFSKLFPLKSVVAAVVSVPDLLVLLASSGGFGHPIAVGIELKHRRPGERGIWEAEN
jgi:hypothetical protein